MIARARLRLLAAGLLAASAITPMAAVARPAGTPPNIVVILADDLGYGDLGVQGGKDVRTPRIDRLARQGVRMTQFYSSAPVCGPSRAALMTGRQQNRFGFENNMGAEQRTDPTAGLPRDLPTIAERLRGHGYATGMIGKWHIGFTAPNTPVARGFDYFYGFLDGAIGYIPTNTPADRFMLRGTQTVPHPAHTTDTFADEAVGFVQQNRDKPFFLYVPFNAVHAPLQSITPYLDQFKHVADPKRRTYLAMLSAFDRAVGRIVDAVDQAGLGRDTLIVFTSDNGGPTWQTTSSNGPLNGVKALLLEGGIRVPTIVRWTGQLPSGEVSRRVGVGHDIPCMAMAVAGVPADPTLDCVNLLPDLRARRTGFSDRPLYWRSNIQGAARQGQWKWLRVANQSYLFNLATDSGERRNVAGRNPQVAQRLQQQWEAWNATLPAPRWAPLNRSVGSADALRHLVDNYVHGRPVDPRPLLYGGGPE